MPSLIEDYGLIGGVRALIQTAYIIEHQGVNRLPAAPFNAQVAEIKAA